MPILEGGPAGWRWYFERMFGVHAAIEPLLWPGAWCGELDAERRATKRDWLRHDLLRMESDVEALPRMGVQPYPWSDAARWGMAWVLEGSSLGNRALSSMVPDEYRDSEFLRGYGEQTAAEWQTFKAALDGQDRLESEEVAESAVALFRRIGLWLDEGTRA